MSQNSFIIYGKQGCSGCETVKQMLGFKQKGSAYEFVMDGFAAIIEAQKAQNEVEMQDPTMIASKVVSKVEDAIINKVKAVGEELELRPVLVEAALDKLKACKGQ